MVGTTLRLATKVLGKLRVPLVLVNGNADVVTAINDDLLISNVEFTNAVLLVVVAFTDVTSLAFVTIGEDIDDGRTAVFEEVRLGCKVLLEKICTPDVWLTTVELRSNMEGLDISVTELDNITEDVLDNDGTSELVLTDDISVLFIVDETRLVNKDDVGIGEIAFDSVEFPG